MNQTEFSDLHEACVAAFRSHIIEAETTIKLLANCTADPMSLEERLGLLFQEVVETNAHNAYLNFRHVLHQAALHGYAYKPE